mmetsp:Transcript_137146/g.238497  ORF Transcript_137146/g.238497 Transcript_137146/m.238497 type:complete len:91 (-) Transcript_137146:4263-4535(-)
MLRWEDAHRYIRAQLRGGGLNGGEIFATVCCVHEDSPGVSSAKNGSNLQKPETTFAQSDPNLAVQFILSEKWQETGKTEPEFRNVNQRHH